MTQMYVDKTYINGRIATRPDHEGNFDELFANRCDVHMEMMDNNCLWIGLRYKDSVDEVHVTISARGKLKVVVNDA